MRGLPIDVAVNVVRDASGRVLLAQRTPRQVSAGFWELPGGKIDGGESAALAAQRELEEEIGIHAQRLVPWMVYEHAFPTKRVRLHFFRVEQWRGRPHGREGQQLAWVDPAAAHVAPLLPSNVRALALLALPPLMAVTRSADLGGPQALLARLPALLAAGVRLIQVREPTLSGDQRVQFARRVRALAAPFGARVALHGTPLETRLAAIEGMHSSATDLRRFAARPAVALWSVSCHTAEDLRRAQALGADYVLLSPVRRTASHEGNAPLGWEGLARQAACTPLPVYAQGGVSAADVARARAAGAVGVAVAAKVLLSGAAIQAEAA